MILSKNFIIFEIMKEFIRNNKFTFVVIICILMLLAEITILSVHQFNVFSIVIVLISFLLGYLFGVYNGLDKELKKLEK